MQHGPAATAASPRVHVSQVTVHHCDIFRRFGKFQMVRMSPYVEVSLGGRIIGTAPPAIGADTKPVWNFTMLTDGFDASQELKLRVLDKHTWPRKDVLIGVASVRPEELLSGSKAQLLEQTIKLFKKHQGDPTPELTGNISLSLNILWTGFLPTQHVTRGASPPCEEPGFPKSLSSVVAADAYAQSRSSTARSTPSPLDRGGDPETNSREVASRLSLLAAFEDSLPPRTQLPMDERMHLVTRQYFGRDVREERRRPVFCTSGVCELLRRRSCRKKCCGCFVCCGSALAGAWALGFL